MEAFDTILSRRSIREYTDKQIDQEIIDQLLQAAMSAPSARNTQSWQFIVINNREVLNKIPNFHPYSEMLKTAPLAICVCGDYTLEKDINYLNQNCSAATENILLAAHALGLGAVWLSVFPREKRVNGIINLLKLPDHIVPISLISLGYPAEKKERADRFNRQKIHINQW